MRGGAPGSGRRAYRAAIALGAGLGGLVIAGVAGAVVGVIAGAAAARRSQLVMLAAAMALAATAAFAVFEKPLDDVAISRFPLDHPLAELSAKVAAVLLLAGLVGTFVSERRPGSVGLHNSSSTNRPLARSRATRRVPASTIAAILGAALLGAVTLWLIGDRRWESVGLAVAIATASLAVLLALVTRIRSLPAPRFVPIPAPAAFLNGLRRDHGHMLGGSVWLLAATFVVSLGSFVFWVLVARRAPVDDVGRAAALFSASLFICYLTSLGLPIAVTRYASDRAPGSASLFAWSLVLTTASSLAGVAAFIALAPDSIEQGLAAARPGFAWLLVFLLVAGLSISELVDVRLMVLRRWSLVFLRSVVIAALRLPLILFVPDTQAALYVYVVALGAFAITGVAFLVPLARQDPLRLGPLPAHSGRVIRFAGVNYLGQLAVQAPIFAVPFVVLVQVDAVANAHFYLSWGVMSVVYIAIQMIGQALLVEGGRGGADHRHQAAVALGVGLAVAGSATVLSLGIGPLLADLYGPGYAPVATLLPLLVAGTIPFAVTITLLTAARIREHSDSTLAVAVTFALGVLVPTAFLTAGHGAVGAAWGWTLGNTIAAVLALVAFLLLRRERRKRSRPATTPLLAPIPGWQRAGRRG